MINIAVYQSKSGLNVQGLEKCDIDFSIIKSKIGYLQKWTEAKQYLP
jgi:hypothetical protein